MRRVDCRTNDGAVALVLVGVLVLAAAAGLYASGGSPDDVVSCPSLAAIDRPGPQLYLSCGAFRNERAHLVRGLAIAGAVIVALGLLTAPVRWVHQGEDLGPSQAAIAWSLLPPAVFFVLVVASLPPGQTYDGVISGLSPVYLAGGVFLAWWGASLLRQAAIRAHLLAAAAVAVPLALGGTASVAFLGRPPSSMFRGAQFSYLEWWPPAVSSAAAVALTFAAAVALTRSGRPAPNVWVAGSLFAVSVAVPLTAFDTDLVPVWRNVDAYGYDGPGPSVWAPLVLGPAVLAVLVWAAFAARRPVTRDDANVSAASAPSAQPPQ